MTRRRSVKRKVAERWSCSWSELPADILLLIIEKLCFLDQFHFRGVCKSWRRIYGTKFADKLPWLIGEYELWGGLDTEGKDVADFVACQVHDPFHKQTFRIAKSIEQSFNLLGRWYRMGSVVCSKHGWVLFSTTTLFCRNTSLLLFQPFTNEIVQLPRLVLEDNRAHSSNLVQLCPVVASFSTSPSSPDCVIMVLTPFSICTYSLADKEWISLQYQNQALAQDVVFLEGSFYWASKSGLLVSFSVGRQEVKTYSITVLVAHGEPIIRGNLYLVESDGDLLLVHSLYADGIPYCKIFKFDWVGKLLVEVETLGNRMLLLGAGSSISILAEEEASEFSNTVHLELSNPSRKIGSYFYIPGRCLPYSQICDWNPLTGVLWIQPPRSRS